MSLGLLVILVIFHRPIIFEITHRLAIQIASRQNITLSYDISGSIFSTLTISNLKGIPTQPGDLLRLEIGRIHLEYSLAGLIRHGLAGFVQLLDVRDVWVEIVAGPPPKLDWPAFVPEIVNIQNLNFAARAPTGDFEIAGFYLSLLPDRPGDLLLAKLNLPGVRQWQDISAATTYLDRNLVLTRLVIGPEISLQEFRIDASKFDAKEIGCSLQGSFLGAPVSAGLRVTDIDRTNRLTIRLETSGLSLDALSGYLNAQFPLRALVARCAVNFEGEPDTPSTWNGKLETTLSGTEIQQQSLGEINASGTLTDGRAAGRLTGRLDGKNTYAIVANAALPASRDAFAKTSGEGKLEVVGGDLEALRAPGGLAGDLTVRTNFAFSDGVLSTDSVIDSAWLAAGGLEMTETHAKLEIRKNLLSPAEAPVFHELVTSISGTVSSLRFQDYSADALRLTASSNGSRITVDTFSLAKAENTLTLRGQTVIPDDLRSWFDQPLEIDLNLAAPNLAAFAAPDGSAVLKGSLKIAGSAQGRNRDYRGQFLVAGQGIEALGLSVQSIDGRLSLDGDRLHLVDLAAELDGKNTIKAVGSVVLSDSLAYEGRMDAALGDLAAFGSLLADGSPIGGSLRAAWEGKGEVGRQWHQGSATIDLTRGRFGTFENAGIHAAASYSPQYIDVPDVRITAGTLGDAALSLFWKDDRLQIWNLTVTQRNLKVLEGSADVPLHLAQARDPEALFPANEPVNVSLHSKDLDLRTLFQQAGQKNPPLSGKINFALEAHGTLDELAAEANLRAEQLQSSAAARFEPAAVSLRAAIAQDRLTLEGEATQPQIQPLRIAGSIPMDLARIKREGAIDPHTPLNVSLTLPRTSLDVIASLVPQIRDIRGTADIDARVSGTIAEPSLSGVVEAEARTLRFADASLPPVGNLVLRLNLDGNTITVDRCSAGLAGGSFQGAGSIKFPRLDAPELNLRLGSRNALVMQNADLTVRVSGDLRVAGPLSAAKVSGRTLVTRSRFFKNIEILPIGLPGRPAPQPPADPLVISFPKPPLRDWTFDVAVRTEDAFLIQSGLANGRITMDLLIGGTGLAPWMTGSVHVENLTATLPFSRLRIDSGLISFKKEDPFVPQLNLRATSSIREYEVTVFITGPLTNPQAVFTSDPPLPQTEIVSLLATGSTTEELSQDPNVLAGRAAILVFRRLYRSVFQRNRPPGKGDEFLNNVQLDVGATDPKTGKQSISLGIPLSSQIMLVGGLDVGGNFRGQVKYLLRFR